MFLVSLSDSRWPDPIAVNHDGEESATARYGQLLYVGVTRAKREMIMTLVGEPTRLLPANDDLWLDYTA